MKNKKQLFLPVSLLLLVFTVGCGGTKYLDANEDKGSVQWGPREIKSTVGKMVGSMHSFLKDDWQQPAYVQVKKFRNKTSEHIDTALISNEITNNLLKRRIKFVDESLTDDAIKEMEKGMSGMIDPESAIPVGYLKSPNLYLTGDIRDNVRVVGNKRVQYVVVTMKLINLKTQMLEWQEQKEFLKSTSTRNISF